MAQRVWRVCDAERVRYQKGKEGGGNGGREVGKVCRLECFVSVLCSMMRIEVLQDREAWRKEQREQGTGVLRGLLMGAGGRGGGVKGGALPPAEAMQARCEASNTKAM